MPLQLRRRHVLSMFPFAVCCLGVHDAIAQTAADLVGRRWPSAADYQPPAGVGFRPVTILSDVVRLHGELFWQRAAEGQELPAIVMANGWGGVAAALRHDASDLAEAGYLVLLFDYRGWGESDGRVVLSGPPPAAAGTFAAQVTMLRGYIDPFEQVEDWFNAIDWLAAEPMADMGRLGLRGTSYSGGHVVHVAAHDSRVRAIVSQVPGIASRPAAGAHTQAGSAARERATQLARGLLGYPPPGERTPAGLIGAPVGDKLLRWWPNDDAGQLTAPALFILAENDELVRNKDAGEHAYNLATGPKRLVVIPGISHYGIYAEARGQAIHLAIDWFNQYLTPPR
jgi:uncharacterized protein